MSMNFINKLPIPQETKERYPVSSSAAASSAAASAAASAAEAGAAAAGKRNA